jgi:hypothetical protein
VDPEPDWPAVAEQGQGLAWTLLHKRVDGGELPLADRGGGYPRAVDPVGERFLSDLLLADQDAEKLQQFAVGGGRPSAL